MLMPPKGAEWAYSDSLAHNYADIVARNASTLFLFYKWGNWESETCPKTLPSVFLVLSINSWSKPHTEDSFKI